MEHTGQKLEEMIGEDYQDEEAQGTMPMEEQAAATTVKARSAQSCSSRGLEPTEKFQQYRVSHAVVLVACRSARGISSQSSG
jgi:hypothetical protein